jgi:hypothetical protein
MNQTSVEFNASRNKIIVLRGTKSVNIKKHKTRHGGHATLNLFVAGNGFKASAFVIFKGKKTKGKC